MLLFPPAPLSTGNCASSWPARRFSCATPAALSGAPASRGPPGSAALSKREVAAARRQEQRLQLRRPSRSARGCRWGRGALALLLALGCALLDSLTQSELHAPEHAANGHLRRGHLFAEAFGLGNLLDFGGSAGLRKEPLWCVNHRVARLGPGFRTLGVAPSRA